MLVSVILPVYNAQKYLSKAIESIVDQSYQEIELIIINDGSTDDSLDIIKKYLELDSRIKLITRKNKGLVYSLNEGVKKSKGAYIARMDADDISLKDRIKKQVNILDSKPDIDIVGCHYKLINQYDELTGIIYVPIKRDDILFSLCYTTPAAHPSIMLRRSLFDIQQYEEDPVEDYLLWTKLYNKNIFNIDEPLLLYRYHYGDSFSDTKRISMMESEKNISKYFYNKNLSLIHKAFDDILVCDEYCGRALSAIYSNSDKSFVIKTLFKKPELIYYFMKYYIRDIVRRVYWNTKLFR